MRRWCFCWPASRAPNESIVGQDGILRAGCPPAPCGRLQTSGGGLPIRRTQRVPLPTCPTRRHLPPLDYASLAISTVVAGAITHRPNQLYAIQTDHPRSGAFSRHASAEGYVSLGGPARHRVCAVGTRPAGLSQPRSEEHTSELQSPCNLVCRLLLEKT